ncbi:E3 ubiquitin-protein ligase ZSWIM2 isoform X2 [Oryzias melastigma]|uniref:E3 ubiquitin-protein ligase ZSWIM2 isoform X2 n=1 Tax=Oryzias melastigma TaxID=30732 RepID=UPI000CF7FAE1|nr:E3 ubiquitin-protein ligase ZSWIM2 isoform X2 [Oryzias melastigma]
MFRKTPWRETIPDSVTSCQDEALASTIRVLVPYSLAAFLVEEEGATQTFKVCLGDPHTCTCPVFAKEAELCKHICWILLRRFKLPRGHEYSFQRGLEVKQLLELLERLRLGRPGAESVRQKRIEPRDVCPVCLEELLLMRLPVSHCSCGNSVHISCMTIWAETQKVTDREKSVTCPLCRGAFSSLALLQEQAENVKKLFTAAEREEPDRHVGVSCCGCRLRPVTGRCFKCTVCSHTFLCEDCRGSHSHHPLAFKTRRMEDWRPWSEGASCQDGPVPLDPLPDHVMGDLPVEFVGARPFPPTEGAQCRLCLISFRRGHRVRNLPCGHKFHIECIDPILRESSACPLDGYVLYSTPMTSPRPLKQVDTSQEKPTNDGSLNLCDVKTAPSCGGCGAQTNDGGARGHASPDHPTTDTLHVQRVELQGKK